MAENGLTYEFGDFRLIPGEGMLLHNGRPVQLTPKAFATLVLLIERRGHLVQKDELMDRVWQNAFVEESAVSKSVWTIRQALGEDPKSSRFIQTVPKRGYRFIGKVETLEVSLSGLLEDNGRDNEAGAPNGTASSHVSWVYRLPLLPEDKKTDPEGILPIERPAPSVEKGAIAAADESADKALVSQEVLDAAPALSLRKHVIAGGVAAAVVIALVLGYVSLVRTGSAGVPRSLVVLPIAPINTVDHNLLYEVGIAESLINRLASVENFTVRPISSVRGYADAPIDPLAAGREQKADYVLASNYQIADGRIKVTAQLYNVASGKVEETFQDQQDIANVFAAQDTIAADFGNRLMARFGVSPAAPVKRRGTNNEEAYRLYQQAMYLIDRRFTENSKKAREFLEKAVALDPNYARAWAGLALTIRTSDAQDYAEAHQEVVEAVNKALAIDPNLSEAYTVLCIDKFAYEYDLAGAEVLCKQAIALDPNYSTAHRMYSHVLNFSGRHDEGIAESRTAMDLEPISYFNQTHLGWTLYLARRYDEAADQWQRMLVLDPTNTHLYNQVIRALEAQEKYDEAFEWLMKLFAVRQKDQETIQRYKNIYRTSGWSAVVLERINEGEWTLDVNIACAYGRAGEKEKAFEHLEEAFRRREWIMLQMKVHPQLDSLRDDPRYRDLLGRIEGR
jgi:DNA-binding winged helix-turn-helix (wHTH) protein/tetratricopeptide (TPR) repeat protein